MMSHCRRLGVVLCLALGVLVSTAQAQEPELENSLEHLRAQVDGSLEQLRPILEGQALSTWNGHSSLAPSQVNTILADVGMVLVDLQVPLEAFSALAAAGLEADVLAPVSDDIAIAARNLDRAIAQLPLAAQAHQAHALHAGGCEHDDPPLLLAVELVRDISATLGLIDGTLRFYEIIGTP